MEFSQFWHGKRVLVTGHTGFKGAWLSLWLEALGAKVFGLALNPERSSLFSELNLDTKIVDQRGDVRSRQSVSEVFEMSDPDIVLHLAAQSLVRASYDDPVGTWATNVMGTMEVLRALGVAPPKPRVALVVTTDKVYENLEEGRPFRENDRLGGHDNYSASKAASELLTSSWVRSFFSKQTQIRVATVRAGNVVGGGDWAIDRLVPDIVRAALTETELEVRNPAATRPWQHVLEPLYGYLLLAQSLFEGKTFLNAVNFGPENGSQQTVKQVIDTSITFFPSLKVRLASEGQPHEAQILSLSVDLAREQLGWFPRWDFNHTISRTLRWYCNFLQGQSASELCLKDIRDYMSEISR